MPPLATIGALVFGLLGSDVHGMSALSMCLGASHAATLIATFHLRQTLLRGHESGQRFGFLLVIGCVVFVDVLVLDVFFRRRKGIVPIIFAVEIVWSIFFGDVGTFETLVLVFAFAFVTFAFDTLPDVDDDAEVVARTR